MMKEGGKKGNYELSAIGEEKQNEHGPIRDAASRLVKPAKPHWFLQARVSQ